MSEWTRETVLQIRRSSSSDHLFIDAIVDSHNAALAAALEENQHNPTTGEWTVGQVFAYWETEDFQGICDLHKAALAAARESAANAWLNSELGSVKKLSGQLAMAREALEEISRCETGWASTANAALAKIGGK